MFVKFTNDKQQSNKMKKQNTIGAVVVVIVR